MSDIPEDIMAEAAALVTLARANIPVDVQELLVQGDPMRGIQPHAIARALMGHEAALRQERDDARASYANLINIIASIREKSGVGAKPMLGDLADAIEARIAAAEQRGVEKERERCAKVAEEAAEDCDRAFRGFSSALNAASYMLGRVRAIAAAIRRGE